MTELHIDFVCYLVGGMYHFSSHFIGQNKSVTKLSIPVARRSSSITKQDSKYLERIIQCIRASNMVLYHSWRMRGKVIICPQTQDDLRPPLVTQLSSLCQLDSWVYDIRSHCMKGCSLILKCSFIHVPSVSHTAHRSSPGESCMVLEAMNDSSGGISPNQ